MFLVHPANDIDMFMLDSKSTLDGHEFCDVIVVTEKLQEWDSAMCSYYEDKGYNVQHRSISHGYQKEFSILGET